MARSRRHTPRRSNAFIGLMAVIVAAIILYFGFTAGMLGALAATIVWLFNTRWRVADL